MKNEVLPKVFAWMFIGLLITFASSYTVSLNTNMLENIFSGGAYWILLIVEIVVAIVLSTRIYKMKGTTATFLYLLYTFLTGLTFSFIFVVYDLESIIMVFLITAILFGLFALIGKYTKIDLSKFSTFLFMGLLGVILLSIVNIFFLNETLDMTLSIISIIIFLGYTAYDIQRIKSSYGLEERSLAIIGAFSLYLDFINIFLDLLNLLGKSDD